MISKRALCGIGKKCENSDKDAFPPREGRREVFYIFIYR